jgi:hypothetical protein
MEPVASLQSSQQHTVCPVHALPPYFNIILRSTSRSLKLLRSFKFPHQNSVCISLLPHTCYMPRPPGSPWCGPITAFGAECKSRRYSLCSFLQSPVTPYLRSKYLCRHPSSGTPSSWVLPWRRNFSPYQTTGKIMVLFINICVFTLPVYRVSL